MADLTRRALFLGLLASSIAGPAFARGCWRPNGWCRQAQRRREREEYLESLSPEDRAKFFEAERAYEAEQAARIEAERARQRAEEKCAEAWRRYDNRGWLTQPPRPTCLKGSTDDH